MRSRFVVLVPGAALAAMLSACASRHQPVTPPSHPAHPAPEPAPVPQPGPRPGTSDLRRLRVRDVERGVTAVRVVDLEAYVAASAISEFAPAAGDEATVERMLEVQAVIARTYAVRHLGRHAGEGFDLCATTHCQLFEPGRLSTSRWAAAARTAAERTAGQVLLYQGAPADAVYHADCGGRISAAADVWGGAAVPYLPGHLDLEAAAASHRSWEYHTTLDALLSALRGDGALDAAVRRLVTLDVLDRDASGRARTLAVNGDAATVRATALRDACTRAFGPRAVRSTLFTVQVAGGTVTFTGIGFGHGVGLCQVGAYARLAAGASVADVLAFYYPGTVVAAAP